MATDFNSFGNQEMVEKIKDWTKATFPQEDPNEIDSEVPKIVASRPGATEPEIKKEIVVAAIQSKPKTQSLTGAISQPASKDIETRTPMAQPVNTPVSKLPPDKKTALYQGLKDKFLSLDGSREEAIKRAQSTQTPGWRTNIGAALMSVASGLNPNVGTAGDYRSRIAAQDKEKYNQIMGEEDNKKSSIMEDVKNLAMLDGAERNAQAADPNSTLSAGLRKAAQMMMPKIAEMPGFNQMSAVEIEKLNPAITDWYKEQVKKQISLAGIESDRSMKMAELKYKEGKEPAKPTVGQAMTDKIFAKEYNDYVLSGKFSDSVKSLDQLDEAVDILKKSWGGATGAIPSIAPDFIRKRVFGLKGGYNAEQMVKEIVQRNLRPILGAQFTEREGQLLMERAFDPALDEKTNIKRIERLATQVRRMAEAKQKAVDYYEDKGTLQGFKGEIPDIESVYTTVGQRKEAAAKEAPEVGTVKRGYEFLGGDPKDTNSWRKL